MSDVQNYGNHRKLVPWYHFYTFGVLVILLIWSLYTTISEFSIPALANTVLIITMIALFLAARVFAVGVQDRVIRLEERMRMERLLADDMKARIPEFTTSQLVGLRFASDAELPALAARVLNEGIANGEDVKKLIKDWRPDHQRV